MVSIKAFTSPSGLFTLNVFDKGDLVRTFTGQRNTVFRMFDEWLASLAMAPNTTKKSLHNSI
jgi:hypothetical protein